MRLPPASLVPAYLALQAAAIATWWAVLWGLPAARAPFVVAGWPEATLFVFVLPDVVVLVVGSLAAAASVRRRAPGSRPLLWLLLGAIVYATTWCLGVNLVTGSGVLATAMMLPACAGMTWAVAVREAPQ